MNSRPYSTAPPGRTSWWRKLAFLATLATALLPTLVSGQTITTTLANNNGSSVVVFSIQNNSPTATYLLTDIGSVCSLTGTGTARLYAKPATYNVAPGAVGGAISSALGWTDIGSNTALVTTSNTAGSGSTATTWISGMTYAIGPLSQVRFCLQHVSSAGAASFSASAGAIRYSTVGVQTCSFTSGDLTVNTCANYGYGGTMASPINTPRGFIGFVTLIAAAPCAGTPNPGNTTGPAAACPNQAFTVGLQNSTPGTGVTYAWERDNGGGYVPFGTSAPTQSVSQTVATSYRCTVTCSGNSQTSNPLPVGMNGFISCYCIPTTTNGCLAGDHITGVSFGTINNQAPANGTCLTASYSDWTAQSTSVGQTANVPITVTINNGGTEYGGAWIDYDQSGTFDATEFIILNGGAGQAGGNFSGTAAIPAGATLGTTRLRVRSSYAAAVAASSSCATYSYGETEDYTVVIGPPPACISPSVSNANVTANSADISWTCGGCTGVYYLEYGLNGFTPGTNASPGTGTMVPGGPFAGGPVTVSGLTSSSGYTVYARQDCGGGNFSQNSGTSFATLLDCATAPMIACGASTVMSVPAGTGIWNLGPVGCPGTGAGLYCTNGKEQVWQFTAPYPGTYVLNTTATNSQWVDFFWKAAGTCDNAGWTYIDDVIGVQSFNFNLPAAGVYYLVGDPEGTSAATQTFNITCPLPCATPQTPAALNVTSTGAQISWTCTSCTGSQFNVEYGPSGFTLGTGTVITSPTSPATITPGSLTPTTPYQAYVYQDCNNVGDGLSNPSAVVSFTTLAPPPANDDCVNAIPVTCGNTYTGTNVAATNDGVPSQASGGEATVDNGVWYIYTPTVTGEQVTASLCTGTAFDSRIHIFQGACGSLVGVAGADDVCGVQSSITWNALPGITYYIAVEGYSAASGTFNLAMTCGPLCLPYVTNDLCANRTVISMTSNCVPFGGNLSCATNSAGNNPACIGGFNPYPDAYYEFVATAPDAFVTLTGGANLRFVLYNNTCVTTAGTEVYCSAAVTSGTPTLVTGLTTGNTYVLRVMQLQANAAPFTLCVQKLDVSDDPCAPVSLACNDQRYGRTIGRLNNIPTDACPFNGAASTGGVNYWSYTALADEDVTFSTCGLSTFDSRISVFTGPCSSLACSLMSDNAAGCTSGSSTVQIRAVTGQTYTIMVHGAGAAQGDYQLIAFCEPYCSGTEANDRCTNAVVTPTHIENDGTLPSTETTACSYLDGPTSCSGANNVQGVWYEFTTEPTGTDYDLYIATNVENPTYSIPTASFALYSGTCSSVGATGELMCVPSAGGTTQLPPLAASTTYRLLVYNTGGISEGTFGLMISHPGFNDGGISSVTWPVGTVCDQRFQPVVTLTNYGEAPLSSATIVSRVNGSIVATYSWSGPALATGSSVTITLPLITVSAGGGQSYSAEVTSANGQPDALATNDLSSSNFDATGQSVKVTVRTDNNPTQISWAIFDAFFIPVGQSSLMTQPNEDVTTEVCLATTLGNCWYFFLFDSFGDGIVGGLWSLTDVNGRMILQDNGAYTGQSPSISPASPIYFAHEFCLPLGPSPIQSAECNVFNNYLNNKVYTTAVAGVINYQFEFSDPNAGFYRRISVPRNWVKFGEMVSTPLVYGTTYFCRVRADQGASGYSDDFYGAGCEMALAPTQPICTELMSTPGTTFSCGVTKPFGGSAKIWAQPVTYATQYRFRFTGMIDADGSGPGAPVSSTRIILRTSYVCPLNWATYTLVNGQTYQVDVECFVGGSWTGYCGAVCSLTIQNPPAQGGGRIATEEVTSHVSLWPNPVRDGRVNLVIKDIADEAQVITVDVFDMYGKGVMAERYENSGSVFNRVLDLDADIAAGTYVVRITVNDQVHVERLSVTR